MNKTSVENVPTATDEGKTEMLFAIEIPITVLILLLYIIMGHKFETYKELNKEIEKTREEESTKKEEGLQSSKRLRRTYSGLQQYEIDHRLEGFRFRGFSCAFHESGPAIILGLAVGLLLQNLTDEDITFNPDMFYYFVLPPIIFYQGYALKKKNFFEYLQYIVLYGLLGTVIQFGIVAFVTFWLTNNVPFLKLVHPQNGETYSLSVRESMIAAACFSAADEVATLSLIKANEHPKLSAVLFGEGVFNDAMSILLYKTVDKTYSDEEDNQIDITGLLQHCGVLLVVGFLVGAGIGLFISRILKVMPTMKEHPAKQTAVIMLGGYFSFCLLEAFGLSGILSVFFCGLTLSHYAWHSLSSEAKTSTRVTFDTMSICAEAYCFACIGMSIHSIEQEDWSWRLIVSMMAALILSRAVAVYGISLVGWLISPTSFTINFKEQTVLVLGGLVRGAIAWAQVSQVSVEHAAIIRTTTLGVIMITTLCFGILLPPTIKILGLKAQNEDKDENVIKMRKQAKLRRSQSFYKGFFRKKFFEFDDKVLRPLFRPTTKSFRSHFSRYHRAPSFIGKRPSINYRRESSGEEFLVDSPTPSGSSPRGSSPRDRKQLIYYQMDADEEKYGFLNQQNNLDEIQSNALDRSRDGQHSMTVELAERFKNKHQRHERTKSSDN